MSHGPDPGPRRIVLVGFMAAGKTTVGEALAARVGWEFLDFDRLAEARTGRSVGTLIREQGLEALRAEEAAITAEVAGRDRVVLAPGGGWVTNPELPGLFGHGTLTVWLRVSAAEAVRRAAADGVDRPLLERIADTGEDSLLDRVEALLSDREPWYAAAELVVDVDEKAPAVVVDEIVRRAGIIREDDER